MALLVPCTFCGLRPVEEFMYAQVPAVPDDLDDPDARDVDRVFMKTNRDGPSAEAWFHTSGCRRWSYLTRDRSNDTWLP